MVKKKSQGLAQWQASKPNASWLQLSYELVNSAAWNALTRKQQNLYLFALQTRYSAIKAAGRYNNSDWTPTTRWKDYNKVTEDTFYIKFNDVVRANKYAKYDEKSFYSDRKALVILGFLDIIIDGKLVGYKEPSVYRMSGRWQHVKEGDVKNLKNIKVIGSKTNLQEQDKIIHHIGGK